MNLEEFIKARKMIQGLDSFPSAENVDVKPHRIVKKQMAPVDGPVPRKNKRSVFTMNKNLSEDDGQDDKNKEEKATVMEKGGNEGKTFETEISIKPKNLNYEEKLFKIRVSLSKNIDWRDNIEGLKENLSLKEARDVDEVTDETTTPLIVLDEDTNSDSATEDFTFEPDGAESTCEDTLAVSFTTRKIITAGTPTTQKCVSEGHVKKEAAKSSKEKEKEAAKNSKENQVIDNLKHYVGRYCKQYDRYPDNTDCHFYFECEVQPDGNIKLMHKKCPEGEIFYSRHLECLKYKYLKLMQKPHRQKRHSLMGSERKFFMLDPSNEADPEPSNEWVDASKSGDTKIPSEFKPVPKPVLRVFHLQCKRQHEMIPHHSFTGKHKMFAPRPLVAINPKILRLNRQRARSSFVKVRKKDTKSDEGYKKTQKVEEEDEESDEDDDEEENDSGKKDEDEDDEEDDEKEEKKATSEKVPEKQKETIKDFFKTSKDAVNNKVNFKEESTVLKSKASPVWGAKTALEKSKTEEDKKVLVDANIRLDSSLSNILKGLFSGNGNANANGKEKNIEKKSSEEETSRLSNEEKNFRKGSFEYLSAYQNLILSNPRLFKHYMSTART